MPRPPSKHPTDGELEILELLWEIGPASLSQVCAGLREHREVATTTVSTMLKVMLDKGQVKRTKGVRGSLWSARKTRRTTVRGMMESFVDRTFDGSAQRLVAHVIEEGKLSKGDREAIRRLLDEHEKIGLLAFYRGIKFDLHDNTHYFQ